jgi:Fe2+ or Zn2+ uptake regulation protein
VRQPTDFVSAFRARGLKVTPQRQLLFRLLSGNETHPCADALFAAADRDMPGISLRTVYQTLNDLVAMGELQMLDLGTGSARFDPNTDDHHHVVCARCGNVRDVYVTMPTGLAPDDALGYRIDQTEVVFRGLCAECAVHGAARHASPPTPSTDDK